jgi:hypothetical protein
MPDITTPPSASPGLLEKITATTAAISTPVDQNPPVPAPISASVLNTYLVTIVLALVSVSSLWATAVHYWQTRDLVGAVNWLRSSEFTGAIAPVVAAVTLAGMFWRTQVNVKLKTWLASHLPNHVAFVVGQQTPALPPRAPETATAVGGEKVRLVGMPVDPTLPPAAPY